MPARYVRGTSTTKVRKAPKRTLSVSADRSTSFSSVPSPAKSPKRSTYVPPAPRATKTKPRKVRRSRAASAVRDLIRDSHTMRAKPEIERQVQQSLRRLSPKRAEKKGRIDPGLKEQDVKLTARATLIAPKTAKKVVRKAVVTAPKPPQVKATPRAKRQIAQAARMSGDKFLTKQAVRVGRKEDVKPSLLMGVMDVETDFARAPGTFTGSSAGAQGVTQFMPATAESYDVDVAPTKRAIKTQVRGAARYLKDLGVNEDETLALAGYNAGPANPAAAGTYPQDVQASAAQYAKLDRVKSVPGGKPQKPLPKKTVSRFEAITDEAKKIDSAKSPYLWGGGHVEGKVPGPRETRYDCSSAVSRVLQQAGYDLPRAYVSGEFEGFGEPGEGAVTIYANPTHVFMKIGNRYWGTSGSNPGGGPGFIPKSVGQSAASSGTYAVRHVPGLGQDIARRMGVRISSSPGLSYSPSGTTATITDGVIRSSPGAADLPIKLDPKTIQRRKAKKAQGRSALIRKLIAETPTASPTISAPSEAELVAEEVALGL